MTRSRCDHFRTEFARIRRDSVRIYLPMNQNVSAAETSGVNEIVTQGEVLRQVLIRTVGSQDAQVMLVLKHNRHLGGRNLA
jgi:hypothetical protein